VFTNTSHMDKYTHAFRQLCNKYSHNKKILRMKQRSKYLSHWCERFIKIYFLSCLRKHFSSTSHLFYKMMPDNFPTYWIRKKIFEFECLQNGRNWDWIFFSRWYRHAILRTAVKIFFSYRKWKIFCMLKRQKNIFFCLKNKHTSTRYAINSPNYLDCVFFDF